MKLVFNKKIFLWCLLAAAAVVALTLGLYFGLREQEKALTLRRGAIVSNGALCAPIGQLMLGDGGSAVDSAIATLFCEGVLLSQSMGIGGGFLATIYNRETGIVETINAREAAPLAATEDMFVNAVNITGAISAAVPGEVLGYWEMHQKYGKLPWKQLILPSIVLCEQGHPVSKHMSEALKIHEWRIQNEPTMSEVFINPKTGGVWVEGDLVKRPKLAKTLSIIAEQGADSIYNGGELGKLLAKDVQDRGGLITEQDLKEFTVQWLPPTVATLQEGYNVYSSPLPGSGSVLSLILNMMDNLRTTDRQLMWHRIVETFKHAYGQRTKLGDVDFEPSVKAVYENLIDPEFARNLTKYVIDDKTFEDYDYYGADFADFNDHGTANMAVLAPNGDAVVVTSTVNTYFGSKFRSVNTGIILNDEMDDFSTPGTINGFGIPASPANFIKPKKRPMSSMCPTIVVDKQGDVKLIIGGAGGSKITTSVAQIIQRYLYDDEPLLPAMHARRLHHQLAPMQIDHEYGFDEEIVRYLAQIGHKTNQAPPDSGFAALTAIGFKTEVPVPVYDERRKGSVAIMAAMN